ncbi:MAG: hypothetical protein IE887_09710 [Campylobacterales bacterium]|nr:hypothetical protein [Campylobacterales bacterium]
MMGYFCIVQYKKRPRRFRPQGAKKGLARREKMARLARTLSTAKKAVSGFDFGKVYASLSGALPQPPQKRRILVSNTEIIEEFETREGNGRRISTLLQNKNPVFSIIETLPNPEEAAEMQRKREESEKNRWRSVEQDGFLPPPTFYTKR